MTAYVTVRLKVETTQIADHSAAIHEAVGAAEDICASADECTILKVELE